MSAMVDSRPPAVEAPKETRSRHRRTALYIAVGFALLCLVRAITGANELTSSGTIGGDPDRDLPDRHVLASAACGPSVPASSTSASRA